MWEKEAHVTQIKHNVSEKKEERSKRKKKENNKKVQRTNFSGGKTNIRNYWLFWVIYDQCKVLFWKRCDINVSLSNLCPMIKHSTSCVCFWLDINFILLCKYLPVKWCDDDHFLEKYHLSEENMNKYQNKIVNNLSLSLLLRIESEKQGFLLFYN